MTTIDVHLTPKSSNAKTGPIPVTTMPRATCWEGCAFYSGVCYALSGPLRLHWDAVSNGKRGISWDALCAFVADLDAGQLWRHAQAGDLPGNGAVIDTAKLYQLIAANAAAEARGFTYTHKPMDSAENRAAVQFANSMGFTVNLSGNTPAHADTLADLKIGPVTTALPIDAPKVSYTPAGRKVVLCPAQSADDVTCADCQLCAKADRDFVIGFAVHGSGKKKYNPDLIAAVA